MNIRIEPGALGGSIPAIASKSDAHRNLICAALSDRPTSFAPFGESADIRATMACLRALGADITHQEDGGCTVTPGAVQSAPILHCGESGSTLRFLLPVAAALGSGAYFTGSGRLPQRRISTLISALWEKGIHFSNDTLPFTIQGKLSPGRFQVPGNESSQYISGLLFALPLLSGDSEILVTGELSSEGYVEMTLATLANFGVKVMREGRRFFIPGGQAYKSPGHARLSGDWSGAAFFLAAGALAGPVAVENLDRDSLQGDREIAELLTRFGAKAEWKSGALTVTPAPLGGQAVDVDQIPDLLPILAVLACAAQGESYLCGAARLRDKESDRLASVRAMLEALGGGVTEEADALRIRGRGSLLGGIVDSAGDHRIVMAAAIAALIAKSPVEIRGAEAVEKSYPRFFEDYRALGGNCYVV